MTYQLATKFVYDIKMLSFSEYLLLEGLGRRPENVLNYLTYRLYIVLSTTFHETTNVLDVEVPLMFSY